jgi:hypothetical protein
MIRFDQMPPEVMQAMCTPMHEVLPSSPSTGGSIWLGSLSASMDAQLLREHRIGHLVQALDVPWLPDPATQGLQLEVYRMDLLDTTSADLRVHLEGVIKDIKGAVGRGKNVLIHCQQVCVFSVLQSPLSPLAACMQSPTVPCTPPSHHPHYPTSSSRYDDVTNT